MNTRKKVIKTVYKDENDSEEETGDFSDSGSEAKISERSSSSEDEQIASSSDEFENVKHKSLRLKQTVKQVLGKPKFAKSFVNKISKQLTVEDTGDIDLGPSYFSVKDLTDADKLLPSVLNLSESDSSDDESPKTFAKGSSATSNRSQNQDDDSEKGTKAEYRDVWSHNIHESKSSEEIARKAFLELDQHKTELEQTKATLTSYITKVKPENEFDVNDLLAQGEDVSVPKKTQEKRKKRKKAKDDSDSEMEDWEEVQESKPIPKQGIQLIVEVPHFVCRKTKVIDVEMMMKRKINRVKKEYQIYMHKVHVLSWLGHGNYVSQVLNQQEILAASLSLVPGKECFPGKLVNLKYIKQITAWYKDKMITLKLDKNENKFRPKAPPLKEMLLTQIENRVVIAEKYLVFIFVAMLRALGLQSRIMFNFVTLPIKPPTSELCSLSTKASDKKNTATKQKSKNIMKEELSKTKSNTKDSDFKSNHPRKISQVVETDDSMYVENIMQLDGSDDILPAQTRSTRARKTKSSHADTVEGVVSPPKRSKRNLSPKPNKGTSKTDTKSGQEPKPRSKTNIKAPRETNTSAKTRRNLRTNMLLREDTEQLANANFKPEEEILKTPKQNIIKQATPRITRSRNKDLTNNIKSDKNNLQQKKSNKKANLVIPNIIVTKSSEKENEGNSDGNETRLSRKRSRTVNPQNIQTPEDKIQQKPVKGRAKSTPASAIKKNIKNDSEESPGPSKKSRLSLRGNKPESKIENQQSHGDFGKSKTNLKNDAKADLVNIVKRRIKEAKGDSKKNIVEGKAKQESDEDSDFSPEEEMIHKSESDDDFKPTKISPISSTSKQVRKKKGQQIMSADTSMNKVDVWCEVFVEELEQWISVNVVKGEVNCAENIYSGASHPVCYVVGWDNNNHLKDLTRRYVPHWNTVTRKQRAEPAWWDKSLRPWLGPRTARDNEEDKQLDRMQLDAPLPKSIGEYKNHPLYALKRHLLKFEAFYPPDAATLGFVRGEAVYARECVYTCLSREMWIKEAKVVRLGEQPYKLVRPRPKWDKINLKIYTPDAPLELFGPWQVQDYEPPAAEGGIVPRNAYGNVELFKPCMIPKGTVQIKLPGVHKVAKKLNIDCAPAMIGFETNGGWPHPMYDGFIVCKEFEDILTKAWAEDQERLERKEREKIETRVYGNWRRLIKGLHIRERLKNKYGFKEPSISQDNKKSKAPREPRLFVTKRKNPFRRKSEFVS